MIQLYQPLNFMGMVYREMEAGGDRHETMFAILSCKPDIEDRPGATPPGERRNGLVRECVVRL
jgi:ATP-binding cassette subfamily B protein